MAKLRKRWSTTTIPSVRRKLHGSQAAAYRHVQVVALQVKAAMLRDGLTSMRVWVDERDGRGWQLFERVDLTTFGTEG